MTSPSQALFLDFQARSAAFQEKRGGRPAAAERCNRAEPQPGHTWGCPSPCASPRSPLLSPASRLVRAAAGSAQEELCSRRVTFTLRQTVPSAPSTGLSSAARAGRDAQNHAGGSHRSKAGSRTERGIYSFQRTYWGLCLIDQREGKKKTHTQNPKSSCAALFG